MSEEENAIVAYGIAGAVLIVLVISVAAGGRIAGRRVTPTKEVAPQPSLHKFQTSLQHPPTQKDRADPYAIRKSATIRYSLPVDRVTGQVKDVCRQ